MARPSTAIPKGVRVMPPKEAARLRFAEGRLLSVFERWGFREVVVPTFEYLEVFAAALPDSERVEKFVDRQTGRLLALRPDLTSQVARMVATTLRHHPLPLRLCYAAPIFRHEEAEAGRQREFYQAGVELIGLEKPEADAEVIAMAVESCREVGLTRFQIDVGQVEFLRGMLDALPARPDRRGEILAALRRKDALALDLLLADLACPDPVKAGIRGLTELYGREEVLDRAEALAASERSKRALENLRHVYEVLRVYGLTEQVILDLAEHYSLEYYSGIAFQVFAEGLGSHLGGGGRYDSLIGQFGYECPATGFAFDLEKILHALEKENALPRDTGPLFLIIDFHPDKRQALILARTLRSKGYPAARDIITRDLEGSLTYARTCGIRYALILGERGQREDSLILRDVQSGKETAYGVAQFCDRVMSGALAWPT
ncbi:MAG: ATP phosphoribosyltransferase regulatory subunit [Candidatus Methylomirabilales bacterium]